MLAKTALSHLAESEAEIGLDDLVDVGRCPDGVARVRRRVIRQQDLIWSAQLRCRPARLPVVVRDHGAPQPFIGTHKALDGRAQRETQRRRAAVSGQVHPCACRHVSAASDNFAAHAARACGGAKDDREICLGTRAKHEDAARLPGGQHGRWRPQGCAPEEMKPRQHGWCR